MIDKLFLLKVKEVHVLVKTAVKPHPQQQASHWPLPLDCTSVSNNRYAVAASTTSMLMVVFANAYWLDLTFL